MDLQAVIYGVMEWLNNMGITSTVNRIQGITPLDIMTNKWMVSVILLVSALLFFSRAFKTLSLFFGTVALWSAKLYLMPEAGDEINLTKLISFAIVCLFVGVLWVYVFFVRGDG